MGARRFGWRVLAVAALAAAMAGGVASVAAGTAHPSVTTRHALADNGVINSRN